MIYINVWTFEHLRISYPTIRILLRLVFVPWPANYAYRRLCLGVSIQNTQSAYLFIEILSSMASEMRMCCSIFTYTITLFLYMQRTRLKRIHRMMRKLQQRNGENALNRISCTSIRIKQKSIAKQLTELRGLLIRVRYIRSTLEYL